MSACDACLVASISRARVTSGLEAAGVGPSAAAPLLELEPVAAAAAMDARGIAFPVPELADPNCEVWTICRHKPEYPTSLSEFSRDSDIPHVIYGVGDVSTLSTSRAAVAIVGARRASAYGREVAYGLGRDLAGQGITVVSGMALGIDGAAHRGALAANGKTVAVLAGGPDRAYPRSHKLLHEQIAQRGCVVSESPPGFEARRWSFVARNRIIAALGALTVWVEGSQSSGARHTVDFSEQLGRVCGVVPGPIASSMSAGPNGLLGEVGIIPVRGVDDVLEALRIEGWDAPGAARRLDEDPNYCLVAGAIASGQRTPREISSSIPHLSGRELSRLLGELELTGRVMRSASGEYELV